MPTTEQIFRRDVHISWRTTGRRFDIDYTFQRPEEPSKAEELSDVIVFMPQRIGARIVDFKAMEFSIDDHHVPIRHGVCSQRVYGILLHPHYEHWINRHSYFLRRDRDPGFPREKFNVPLGAKEEQNADGKDRQQRKLNPHAFHVIIHHTGLCAKIKCG